MVVTGHPRSIEWSLLMSQVVVFWNYFSQPQGKLIRKAPGDISAWSVASGVNYIEGNASITSYEQSDLSQALTSLCRCFLSCALVAASVLKSWGGCRC